jgi:MFS family permease
MSTFDANESAFKVAESRGLLTRSLAVSAAGLGMFLAALDIAVNVALPSIRTDLNTDLQAVQWVIVVFIATRAGLVMGAGSLADRFGFKEVYLVGVTLYVIAMVCIAVSPTLELVVAFRVLQAAGTGCLFAVSPAIAAEVFPAHRRGLGMGFATASQALGMLAGTLGGGLLVTWFGWEAIFLGRIPFALTALVLGLGFLGGVRPASSVQSFDFLGATSLLGALLSLVIGLRLGRSVGWTEPAVLVLLSLAPVLLVVLWRAERRASWPVLPPSLLWVGGFVGSCAGMFLAHVGVFVIWFIFPFYIVDALGRSPLSLGVMLALMAGLNVAGSAIGGWLCDHVGDRKAGFGGLLLLSLGLLAMSFLDTGSDLFQVGLRISMVGAGLGLFQAAAFTRMMSSVPAGKLATASGALSLAQAFGTVFSVATVGGVFALSNGYHLSQLVNTGLTMPAAEGHAFMLAFQDVFRLGAAIMALATVVFLMRKSK